MGDWAGGVVLEGKEIWVRSAKMGFGGAGRAGAWKVTERSQSNGGNGVDREMENCRNEANLGRRLGGEMVCVAGVS
jgi:hypothetical protein